MQTLLEPKPTSQKNGRLRIITEVIKRDGRKELFNPDKIVKVVKQCFLDPEVNAGAEVAEEMGHQIARSVTNILWHQQTAAPVEIEYIQRLVLQQLWALNQFDAAEHYSRYREEHRQKRAFKQVSPESVELVELDRRHFPTDLQYYQFLSKFARWRDDLGRRETWREACSRVMDWFKTLPATKTLRDDELEDMDSALYDMEATCAMRVLQMAGPALDRCQVGVYNCAYLPITDLFSFAEHLYILMQGTGSGFSVEVDYVGTLPRVKKQKEGKRKVVHKFTIPDTTEGWCDALYKGLTAWFNGEDIEYDYSLIRTAGSRLKTKGGRSSGPDPLRQLLDFARKVILDSQGGHLADIDVHDLCCMAGKIVQVGGVRRASCISLSDLDSIEMRNAKSGNWYDNFRHRTMANNSAVYEEKPDAVEFMEEWLSLSKSGSGERGIFNRKAVIKHLPERRKKWKFGCNPCAEIVLRPYQFCNLSIAIARPNDTVESLKRKVRIATYFGVLQSTCTRFNYLREDWAKNCIEERLLGVDITGHADCPLLQYGAPGREELLKDLKAEAARVRTELATRFGINQSTADTCVKPAGDSAALFNSGSGISARHSKWQWRWVREPMNSPMAAFLKDEGVPSAVAPEDSSLLVFGFPKEAPDGCTLRDDLTALEQLQNWLEWKLYWAEHSVSCTIYVEPQEWFEVGNWVHAHFDDISGLSFLPKDNGIYRYAPNEELTEEGYDKAIADFPVINWAKLQRYEHEDNTAASRTYACTGDRCELG